MSVFNVYLSGVGGQGIGLISEVMQRSVDHAGIKALGVDTHGLAQRGGIVASQLRIGDSIHSPMVSRGKADLVVALERHEAVRAAGEYLKKNGTLVYYNTSWQPLPVRMNKAEEIQTAQVAEFCQSNGFRLIEVYQSDLPDPRMQNMALLAAICRNHLLAGVRKEHYIAAMRDLMSGKMLEANLGLFERLLLA
ncbi:MAG TPA: 2-oxoacid:acceptor oxidoreductase family protein [Candidatus Rifleibacterium sp.]|nr:2-oxoacid:acceptor oxidoreductase family protein [Candidatus Rifleibacterium sp.]HQB82867.1 2-oxoacid:acceptor oxidoreductase family protein [Candidatus Rifleibacterium sp.]